MVDSLNNTALSGVQKGLAGFQKNSGQIAGAVISESANEKLLITAVVDLKINETQVAASMKVLSASEELIGTILDIKA